jgi:REase_MTES_1575
VVHQGVSVTSPGQTFLDLASCLNLVDLVIFGDSLVRAKRTTSQELIDSSDAWTGSGARLARRAARLVRANVDSPMETRLRLLIVLAGLPEPEINVILRNREGDWVLRFDLCYRDLKLAIEYDGRQHALDDKQWAKDIERRELLDRLGWRLIVVRAHDVYAEPERTLNRIADAMRACGAPTVRRRFKEEWRHYFPGQP